MDPWNGERIPQKGKRSEETKRKAFEAKEKGRSFSLMEGTNDGLLYVRKRR